MHTILVFIKLHHRDSLVANGGVTCRLPHTGRKIIFFPGNLDQSQKWRPPMALWSPHGHNELKKHQKEDFSPRNHKKCDFHFIGTKRRKTTSFNLNEPTKPGQIKSKETEVRWSTIDTKEKFNVHILNIDFIITNINTYGDQFQTSGAKFSIRNIPAESPPSWNSWSRPLMANFGKSTTFVG